MWFIYFILFAQFIYSMAFDLLFSWFLHALKILQDRTLINAHVHLAYSIFRYSLFQLYNYWCLKRLRVNVEINHITHLIILMEWYRSNSLSQIDIVIVDESMFGGIAFGFNYYVFCLDRERSLNSRTCMPRYSPLVLEWNLINSNK